MRKPNWKENNSNWGLSKLGNMEIIKNVLSDTLQIADPLINIFLKQKIKKCCIIEVVDVYLLVLAKIFQMVGLALTDIEKEKMCFL